VCSSDLESVTVLFVITKLIQLAFRLRETVVTTVIQLALGQSVALLFVTTFSHRGLGQRVTVLLFTTLS